jgi:hypothetical protein
MLKLNRRLSSRKFVNRGVDGMCASSKRTAYLAPTYHETIADRVAMTCPPPNTVQAGREEHVRIWTRLKFDTWSQMREKRNRILFN